MYSSILKFIVDIKFKSEGSEHLELYFYVFVSILCLGIFLKYAFKRKYFLKSCPSRKVRLFNPLGNLIDVVGNGKVDGVSLNVYALQVIMGYNELFRHESFFGASFGFTPSIFVTKAKLTEELISRSINTEKNWLYNFLHGWLGTGLLTSHGSKWKARRKLLTHSFHFEILKDFLPIFNEQSEILIKLLLKETKKPWTDIVNPITLCSLDIICETTLGVHIGAQETKESEYIQAISRVSDIFMKRVVYPPYHFDWYFSFSKEGQQFKRDVNLLHNFTRTVICQKKQILLKNGPSERNGYIKKRKALMDLLLEEHIKNGTLTEEDIREEVDTFAFEGHDTTSMGMSWALYLIGLHKDVQERLHEEIDCVFRNDCDRPATTEDLKEMEYLDRVLKESQRLYPSVPGIGRKLSQDTVMGGTKVPKGTDIFIVPYILHRDETVFPIPEKFDPDRFLPENTVNRSPFAYLPFSAGPRNCIGQKFALMEQKVVISSILRNFSLESLDPRDKVLATPELILRSSVPIRIKLRLRRPTAL